MSDAIDELKPVREKSITLLREVADKIDHHYKNSNIARITGSSVAIGGGVATIGGAGLIIGGAALTAVGGILTVATLGATAPIVAAGGAITTAGIVSTVAGAGTGIAGGATAAGATIADVVISKLGIKEAQKQIDDDNEKIKKVCEQIEKAQKLADDIAHDLEGNEVALKKIKDVLIANKLLDNLEAEDKEKVGKKIRQVLTGLIMKSVSQTGVPLLAAGGVAGIGKLGVVAIKGGEAVTHVGRMFITAGEAAVQGGELAVRGGQGVAWVGESGARFGAFLGWFGRPIAAAGNVTVEGAAVAVRGAQAVVEGGTLVTRVGAGAVEVGAAVAEGGAMAARLGGTALHVFAVVGAAIELVLIPLNIYEIVKSGLSLYRGSVTEAGRSLRENADKFEKQMNDLLKANQSEEVEEESP